MVRAPCCDKKGLKRGRWTEEEDEILVNYIAENGEGSWRSLPKNAEKHLVVGKIPPIPKNSLHLGIGGILPTIKCSSASGLLRCGKSCRLRWINYLRSDLKRGSISKEEEEIIIKLHSTIGNRWSVIAAQLPGRTDNEIKNYWNSHLSRRIHCFRRHGDSETFIYDIGQIPSSGKRRGGRTSRAAMMKNSMLKVSASSITKDQINQDDPNYQIMNNTNSSSTFDFDFDFEEVLGPNGDIDEVSLEVLDAQKEVEVAMEGKEKGSTVMTEMEKMLKWDLESLEAKLWEEDGSDMWPWFYDVSGNSSFDEESLCSWLLA